MLSGAAAQAIPERSPSVLRLLSPRENYLGGPYRAVLMRRSDDEAGMFIRVEDDVENASPVGEGRFRSAKQ